MITNNICEWRDCIGFSDYYSVSNNGDVYSKRNKRLLKPKKSKSGYLRVGLSVHGKVKMESIHRLVALAFIPNPDNKPTVNHINEIKTDNRVENLEWATNAEQNIHGTRIERAVKHTNYYDRNINYAIVASKHDYKRNDMCNRQFVKVYDTKENHIGDFLSQRLAAKYTNVSPSQVSECVTGKKKSCKGYVFKKGD